MRIGANIKVTNVSIFDREYLTTLFGGTVFPDGELAIDHIEEIIDCQKVFMEVVSETRETNMFTFPVLTFSLLARNKTDEKLNGIDKNIIPTRDNILKELYREYVQAENEKRK